MMAVGFSIGSKAYIGTGYDGSSRLKTFGNTRLLLIRSRNPFTFTDQTGVALSTVITSNTINGIWDQYIDTHFYHRRYIRHQWRSYTSADGTVNNGDSVTVQQTSSASYSTRTDATLTIGGISDTFSVTRMMT